MKKFILSLLMLSSSYLAAGEHYVVVEGAQLTYPYEGFYLLMINRYTGKFEAYFLEGAGYIFYDLEDIPHNYNLWPLEKAKEFYELYNLDEAHYALDRTGRERNSYRSQKQKT